MGRLEVAVHLKAPDGMTLGAATVQAEIFGFDPSEMRVFEYGLRLDTAGEKKVWAEAEVLGLGRSVSRRV
jgi:hypothetical protein